jgi:hypothetical protein
MSQPVGPLKETGASVSTTIGHKVSVSPLLPGVSVSLNAQPHGAFHVVVFASAGNEPSELYSGLRAVGFTSRAPVAGIGGFRSQELRTRRVGVTWRVDWP